MVIAGGRSTVKYVAQGETYHKSLDVVRLDGSVCGSHSLPDLPKELEGFGMASKNNRYIYVCGGQNRRSQSSDCFTNCGNYVSS